MPQRFTLYLLVTAITTAISTPLTTSWFGLNMGARVGFSKTNVFHNKTFQAALHTLHTSQLRFPGGTYANDFNWKEGCNGLSSSCTGGHSTLEDLQTTLNASSNNNIKIILVLNMVTDTLDSQLQFVAHAITNLGLPVVGVELGNELFNNLGRYIQRYPDGGAYGKVCVQWIAAIRDKFPRLRLAVVGTPTRKQSHVRDTTWNDMMFGQVQSSLRPHVDGVVIHQYDTTGLATKNSSGGSGGGGKFLKSMVSKMLQKPFQVSQELNKKIATSVPTNVTVWITEYNIDYSKNVEDVFVFGTFAHGLFLATESILFLQEPQIAAGFVCRHCLLSDANNGALFVNDKAFNFDQSPNRSLATNTYGLSATGAILRMLGNMTQGMNDVQTLNVAIHSTNTTSAVLSSEVVVVGVVLSNSDSTPIKKNGFVVNLSNDTVAISGKAMADFRYYQQMSVDDPTIGINHVEGQVTWVNGYVQLDAVALAPYSVTSLVS
jgi:hypothetical protein